MAEYTEKYQALSEYLLEKRKTQGLSQKEIADTLGISAQMVSNWEKGKCGPPVEKLEALSKILKIKKEEFLLNILVSNEQFYRSSLGLNKSKSLIKKKIKQA